MWNASVIAAIIISYWPPAHWLGITTVTANDSPQQNEAAKEGEIYNGFRYEQTLVQLQNSNPRVHSSGANQLQPNSYHHPPPRKEQEVNRENLLFSTSQNLRSNRKNATVGNTSYSNLPVYAPVLEGKVRRDSVVVVPQPTSSVRFPFFNNVLYPAAQPQILIKNPVTPILSRPVSVVPTYPRSHRQVSPGNAESVFIAPWSNVREFSVPISKNKGDTNIKSKAVSQRPYTGNLDPQTNIFNGERSAVFPSPEQQQYQKSFNGRRGLQHLKIETLPIIDLPLIINEFEQNPINNLQTKTLPTGDGRNGFQSNAIQPPKVTDGVGIFTNYTPPPELSKFSFHVQQNQQNPKTRMEREYTPPLSLHTTNNPFSPIFNQVNNRASYASNMNPGYFTTRNGPSVSPSIPMRSEKVTPDVEPRVPVLQNISLSIPSIQLDMNIKPPRNVTNNITYSRVFSEPNLNPGELSSETVTKSTVPQATAGSPFIPKMNEQKFTDTKNNKQVWQNRESPDAQKPEARQQNLWYSNQRSTKATANPKEQTTILTDKARQPQLLANSNYPPSNFVVSLPPQIAEDVLVTEPIQPIPIPSQIYGRRVLTSEVVRSVLADGKFQNKIPLSPLPAAGIIGSAIPIEQQQIFPRIINSKALNEVQNEPRRDIDQIEILKPIKVYGDNRKEPVFNQLPIFSIVGDPPFDFTQPPRQWSSRYRIPYAPKINSLSYQPVFQVVLPDQILPTVPIDLRRESYKDLKQYIPFDQQLKGSNALIYPTIPQQYSLPRNEMIQSLNKLRAPQYPMSFDWLSKYWNQGNAHIYQYINQRLPNPSNQMENPTVPSRYGFGDELERSYPRLSQSFFNKVASQPNKQPTVPYSVPKKFYQQVTDGIEGVQIQFNKIKPQLPKGKELIDDAEANVISTGNLIDSADYLNSQPLYFPIESLSSPSGFNTVNQNPPRISHNGIQQTSQGEVDGARHLRNEPMKDMINSKPNIKYPSHSSIQSSYKSFQTSPNQPEIMPSLNHVQSAPSGLVNVPNELSYYDSWNKPTENPINVQGMLSYQYDDSLVTEKPEEYLNEDLFTVPKQRQSDIPFTGDNVQYYPNLQGASPQTQFPGVEINMEPQQTFLTRLKSYIFYPNTNNQPIVGTPSKPSYNQESYLSLPKNGGKYMVTNGNNVNQPLFSGVMYYADQGQQSRSIAEKPVTIGKTSYGLPNWNENINRLPGKWFNNKKPSAQLFGTKIPILTSDKSNSQLQSQEKFIPLQTQNIHTYQTSELEDRDNDWKNMRPDSTDLQNNAILTDNIRYIEKQDRNERPYSVNMYDYNQGPPLQIMTGKQRETNQPVELIDNRRGIPGGKNLSPHLNDESYLKNGINRRVDKEKPLKKFDDAELALTQSKNKKILARGSESAVIKKLPGQNIVTVKFPSGYTEGDKSTLSMETIYQKPSQNVQSSMMTWERDRQPEQSILRNQTDETIGKPETVESNTQGQATNNTDRKKPHRRKPAEDRSGTQTTHIKSPTHTDETINKGQIEPTYSSEHITSPHSENRQMEMRPIYPSNSEQYPTDGSNQRYKTPKKNGEYKGSRDEISSEAADQYKVPVEVTRGDTKQNESPSKMINFGRVNDKFGPLGMAMEKEFNNKGEMRVQNQKVQQFIPRLSTPKDKNPNTDDQPEKKIIGVYDRNRRPSSTLPVENHRWVPSASIQNERAMNLLNSNMELPTAESPGSNVNSAPRDLDRRTDKNTNLPIENNRPPSRVIKNKTIQNESPSPKVVDIGKIYEKHGQEDQYPNYRMPILTKENANIGDGAKKRVVGAYDEDQRRSPTVSSEINSAVPNALVQDETAINKEKLPYNGESKSTNVIDKQPAKKPYLSGAKKPVIGTYDENQKRSPTGSSEINSAVPNALVQGETAIKILEPKEKLLNNGKPKPESIFVQRDLEEGTEKDSNPSGLNKNSNKQAAKKPYLSEANKRVIGAYDENQRRSPTGSLVINAAEPDALVQDETAINILETKEKLPNKGEPKSIFGQHDLEEGIANLPIDLSRLNKISNKQSTKNQHSLMEPSSNRTAETKLESEMPEAIGKPTATELGPDQLSDSQRYSVHGHDQGYLKPKTIDNGYKDTNVGSVGTPAGKYKVDKDFMNGDVKRKEQLSQKVINHEKNYGNGPMTIKTNHDSNGQIRAQEPNALNFSPATAQIEKKNTGDGAKQYDVDHRRSATHPLERNPMAPSASLQDVSAMGSLEPNETFLSDVNSKPKTYFGQHGLHKQKEQSTRLPFDSSRLHETRTKVPEKLDSLKEQSSIQSSNLKVGNEETGELAQKMKHSRDDPTISERFSIDDHGQGNKIPIIIDSGYKPPEGELLHNPAGQYKDTDELSRMGSTNKGPNEKLFGDVNSKSNMNYRQHNSHDVKGQSTSLLINSLRLHETRTMVPEELDSLKEQSSIQSSNLKVPGETGELAQKMKLSRDDPNNSERFSSDDPGQGNMIPETTDSGYKQSEGQQLRNPAGQFKDAHKLSKMESINKRPPNVGVNVGINDGEKLEQSQLTIREDLDNVSRTQAQNPEGEYPDSGNLTHTNKNTNMNDGSEPYVMGANYENPIRSSKIPVERFLTKPKTSLQDESAMDSSEPNNKKLINDLKPKSNMYSRPGDLYREPKRDMILPLDSSRLNRIKHQPKETESLNEALSKRIQSAYLDSKISRDVDKSALKKIGPSVPTNSKRYSTHEPNQVDPMPKTINNEEEAEGKTLRGPSSKDNITGKFNGDKIPNEPPSSQIVTGNDKHARLQVTESEDLDGNGQMGVQYPKQQQSHSISPKQNDKTRNVAGTNQHILNEHGDNQRGSLAFPLEKDRMVPSVQDKREMNLTETNEKFPSDENPKSEQRELDEESDQGTNSPVNSVISNKDKTKFPVQETRSTSKPWQSESQSASDQASDLKLSKPGEKNNFRKQIMHTVPQRTAVQTDVVNPSPMSLITKNKSVGPLLQADVPNNDGTKQYKSINLLDEEKQTEPKLTSSGHQRNPGFSDEYGRGTLNRDKDSHQNEAGRLPTNQYRDANIRGSPDESKFKKPVLEHSPNTNPSKPYSIELSLDSRDPKEDHVESKNYRTGSRNTTGILLANNHEDPSVINYDEEQQDPHSQQQMDAKYANNQGLLVKKRTNKKSPYSSDITVNSNFNDNKNLPPYTSTTPNNVPDKMFGAQRFNKLSANEHGTQLPFAQNSEGDSKNRMNNIEGDRVAKLHKTRPHPNPASATWVEYPSTYDEYKPTPGKYDGSKPIEDDRVGIDVTSHQHHAAPSQKSASEEFRDAKHKSTRIRDGTSYNEKSEVPLKYVVKGITEDKQLQELPTTSSEYNEPGMFSQKVTPTSDKQSSSSSYDSSVPHDPGMFNHKVTSTSDKPPSPSDDSSVPYDPGMLSKKVTPSSDKPSSPSRDSNVPYDPGMFSQKVNSTSDKQSSPSHDSSVPHDPGMFSKKVTSSLDKPSSLSRESNVPHDPGMFSKKVTSSLDKPSSPPRESNVPHDPGMLSQKVTSTSDKPSSPSHVSSVPYDPGMFSQKVNSTSDKQSSPSHDSSVPYGPDMFRQKVTSTSDKQSTPSLKPVSKEIDFQLQRVGNNVIENGTTMLVHNKRPSDFGSKPLNTSRSPANRNADFINPMSDSFRFNLTDITNQIGSKNRYFTDRKNYSTPPPEMLTINRLYPFSPDPKTSSKTDSTPERELSRQVSSTDNNYIENAPEEQLDQESLLNENKMHPQPTAPKIKTEGSTKNNKLSKPDSLKNLKGSVGMQTQDPSGINVDTTTGSTTTLNTNESPFQSPGQQVKEPGTPMEHQQVYPNNEAPLKNLLLLLENVTVDQSIEVPSGFNNESKTNITNSSLMTQSVPLMVKISPDDKIKNKNTSYTAPGNVLMRVNYNITDDVIHHHSSSAGVTTSLNRGLQTVENRFHKPNDDDPYRNTTRNPEIFNLKSNEGQLDSDSLIRGEIPNLDKPSKITGQIPSSTGTGLRTDNETEWYRPPSGNKAGATIMPMFHKEGQKNRGAIPSSNLTQHQLPSQHEMGDDRMKPQSLPDFIRNHPNKTKPSSSTDSIQKYPEPINTLFKQAKKLLDMYGIYKSTTTTDRLSTDQKIIDRFDSAGKDKGDTSSPHSHLPAETARSNETPEPLQATGGSLRELKSEGKSEMGSEKYLGRVPKNSVESSTTEESNTNSDKIVSPRMEDEKIDATRHTSELISSNKPVISMDGTRQDSTSLNSNHSKSSDISGSTHDPDYDKLMLSYPLPSGSAKIKQTHKTMAHAMDKMPHKNQVANKMTTDEEKLISIAINNSRGSSSPIVETLGATPVHVQKGFNDGRQLKPSPKDESQAYKLQLIKRKPINHEPLTEITGLDNTGNHDQRRSANRNIALTLSGWKNVTGPMSNSNPTVVQSGGKLEENVQSPINITMMPTEWKLRNDSVQQLGVDKRASNLNLSDEIHGPYSRQSHILSGKRSAQDTNQGVPAPVLDFVENGEPKTDSGKIKLLIPSSFNVLEQGGLHRNNDEYNPSNLNNSKFIISPVLPDKTTNHSQVTNDGAGAPKQASISKTLPPTSSTDLLEPNVATTHEQDSNTKQSNVTDRVRARQPMTTVVDEFNNISKAEINSFPASMLPHSTGTNNSLLGESNIKSGHRVLDEEVNNGKLKQQLIPALPPSRKSGSENFGLEAEKAVGGSSNPSRLSEPQNSTDFSGKETPSQDGSNSSAYPGQTTTSHKLLEQPDSRGSEGGEFPPYIDPGPAVITEAVRNPVKGKNSLVQSKLDSSIKAKNDERELGQNYSVPGYSGNSLEQDLKALNPDGPKTHPYAGQPIISHKSTEQPDNVERFGIGEESQQDAVKGPMVGVQFNNSPKERMNSKAASLPNLTKTKGLLTPRERGHTTKGQSDNQTLNGQRRLDGKTGETIDRVPLDKTNAVEPSVGGTVRTGHSKSVPGGTNSPKDKGMSQDKLKPRANLAQHIKDKLVKKKLEHTETGDEQFHPATDSDPTAEGAINQRTTKGTNLHSPPSAISRKPASSKNIKGQNDTLLGSPSSKTGAYFGQNTLRDKYGENVNSLKKLSGEPKVKDMERGKNYERIKTAERIEGSPHRSSVIEGDEPIASAAPSVENGTQLGYVNGLGSSPSSSLQANRSTSLNENKVKLLTITPTKPDNGDTVAKIEYDGHRGAIEVPPSSTQPNVPITKTSNQGQRPHEEERSNESKLKTSPSGDPLHNSIVPNGKSESPSDETTFASSPLGDLHPQVWKDMAETGKENNSQMASTQNEKELETTKVTAGQQVEIGIRPSIASRPSSSSSKLLGQVDKTPSLVTTSFPGQIRSPDKVRSNELKLTPTLSSKPTSIGHSGESGNHPGETIIEYASSSGNTAQVPNSYGPTGETNRINSKPSSSGQPERSINNVAISYPDQRVVDKKASDGSQLKSPPLCGIELNSKSGSRPEETSKNYSSSSEDLQPQGSIGMPETVKGLYPLTRPTTENDNELKEKVGEPIKSGIIPHLKNDGRSEGTEVSSPSSSALPTKSFEEFKSEDKDDAVPSKEILPYQRVKNHEIDEQMELKLKSSADSTLPNGKSTIRPFKTIRKYFRFLSKLLTGSPKDVGNTGITDNSSAQSSSQNDDSVKLQSVSSSKPVSSGTVRLPTESSDGPGDTSQSDSGRLQPERSTNLSGQIYKAPSLKSASHSDGTLGNENYGKGSKAQSTPSFDNTVPKSKSGSHPQEARQKDPSSSNLPPVSSTNETKISENTETSKIPTGQTDGEEKRSKEPGTNDQQFGQLVPPLGTHSHSDRRPLEKQTPDELKLHSIPSEETLLPSSTVLDGKSGTLPVEATENYSALGGLRPQGTKDMSKTNKRLMTSISQDDDELNLSIGPHEEQRNSGSEPNVAIDGRGETKTPSSSSLVKTGKSQHEKPTDTEANLPITSPNKDARLPGPLTLSDAQNLIIQPPVQTNPKANSPIIPHSGNSDEQNRQVNAPSSTSNKNRNTLREQTQTPYNLPTRPPNRNMNITSSPSSSTKDAEGLDYQTAIKTISKINSGNYTVFTADHFIRLIERCNCPSLKFLIPILKRPNSGILVTS